jgi:hypothetical protein
MIVLLSPLDVREGFGSWCQSRPKDVYYTLLSSKFMEIFVSLNAAQVAVWYKSIPLIVVQRPWAKGEGKMDGRSVVPLADVLPCAVAYLPLMSQTPNLSI